MEIIVNFLGLILMCAVTAAIVTSFIAWMIYKEVSK
jgi:hypothetical protein